MTQTQSVHQMWTQCASKVLKSGCVLDNHLTLKQLSNYEFNCTQDKRNLLAGMLRGQKKTEGNLLQVDTSSQILRRQRVCYTIGPFDGYMSKMREADVHVFSDSVVNLGKAALHSPKIKGSRVLPGHRKEN